MTNRFVLKGNQAILFKRLNDAYEQDFGDCLAQIIHVF